MTKMDPNRTLRALTFSKAIFLKYFHLKVYLQDIASHVNTISDLNKLYGHGSAK